MINKAFTDPVGFIISAIALLIAITVHEFAHAWAADHLGDPTPRLLGRLTLNPFVHLDAFGLLFLLFFGFGWGKPVTFDPFNLKNPRRDSALISVAGPISNIITSAIFAVVLRLIFLAGSSDTSILTAGIIVQIIYFNVLLALFNLIPIHPLDGFKIVGGILSRDQAREWYALERYGMIFLILLIIPIGQTSMLDLILRYPMSWILSLFIPSSPGMGVI